MNTKYGNFTVVDNGNGGATLLMGAVKICEFPKVNWWDADAINKAIEEHHELIEQRIAERVDMTHITRDNAAKVLEELVKVFGNENKNFYASRLKQCLNKLKA